MKHLIKYLDALESTFKFSGLGSDLKGKKAGIIAYTSGYKYQLMEAYQIETGFKTEKVVQTKFLTLEPTGTLWIRKGYAWDGPSGPTIDTRSSMRGSLVHDALYQLMRGELLSQNYRSTADRLMYLIMVEDGMWKWRAGWWHTVVRKLAGMSADPRSKKNVCYAGAG